MCAVALLLAAVASSEASTPSTVFAVRVDERLCPSPMCGGLFVKRVNHVTTRCFDGSSSAWCYVASRSGVSLPNGPALARGRLTVAKFEGFEGYGNLLADRAWLAAGATFLTSGTVYRVRDNGVRCITTPCFTLDALQVERTRRMKVSDLDLSAARLTRTQRRLADHALAATGLMVTGTVVVVPDAGPAGAGRALVVSTVWLHVS